MDSRGNIFLDLNELPVENDEEVDGVLSFQSLKELSTSNNQHPVLFETLEATQSIINNNAFSHPSSISGFQPFINPEFVNASIVCVERNKMKDLNSLIASSSKSSDSHQINTEREEGECSDAKGARESNDINEISSDCFGKVPQKHHMNDDKYDCTPSTSAVSGPYSDKNIEFKMVEMTNHNSSLVLDHDVQVEKRNCTSGGIISTEATVQGQQERGLAIKQREIKGVEATHALKCANNFGKRQKLDEQREAMLGKKRTRQVKFLKLEDVRQAGPIKVSTPRRQIRAVKEIGTTENIGEKPNHFISKDKHENISCNNGGLHSETGNSKSECNGQLNSGILSRPRRSNSGGTDSFIDVHAPSIPRHYLWKQSKSSETSLKKPSFGVQCSTEPKHEHKESQFLKKQTIICSQNQDTSVERLIREVTSDKFWHHPEGTELQSVPGQFESMEEYVKVFEPLLLEECRAQLYSTWEELSETVLRDSHTMVNVKNVERRDRGWYDTIVAPTQECKWTFKEGDVAILSFPRPGPDVRSRRVTTLEDEEDSKRHGHVAGTVRRHRPVDSRDPHGVILHFHIGDSSDSSRTDTDHILNKLRSKGVWYLTVLGSVATTQREYVALHGFYRLNSQMRAAILKPSPEHFPKNEQLPPSMPECFTPNFVDHLHRTFNAPQLSAIQWAAMHTAAGTTTGSSKRQDPWPFTLVQGPPGTGKTHTVWGMLNVIHLVQYQHYYAALLKKLAPESYKQSSEMISDNPMSGSIDEILQSMDRNLFRTLPKLCPKPRMLVCAPSNAATDELLARVLDRGFIDGEMKMYRPDVARVGVDSQSRAAQAVSVERRTEQLLCMNRTELLSHMHNCRCREAQFSQQISIIQRELNLAAAQNRSQGSVGVDPDDLVTRDQNRDALLQNLAAAVEARDKNLVDLSRFLILETRFRSGGSFDSDDVRANLETSFANEAEIVFTTVSSSGRKLFSRLSHGFDMVVIDEAAQASEVGVLPPLSLGAARCVLVGDPQQLPATVISKAAGTLLYSRSLFERFQQAGCPSLLLSVQYRMHPQIRDFPSRYFYQGRLADSESVAALPDEMFYKDSLLRPYLFYDVTHGRESHRGGSVSFQNIHEAQFCVGLYEHLRKVLKSSGSGKVSVGIITPYKLQLKCLQREFQHILESEEGKDVYINTVDAFQGQERDVIIMSCVRASSHGVGFVADIRRMNVALTRARRALWVMGNANALSRADDWSALINDAKARKCYMDMESLPSDFLPSRGGPTYSPIRSSRPPNMRGLRPPSFSRRGSSDMQVEK